MTTSVPCVHPIGVIVTAQIVLTDPCQALKAYARVAEVDFVALEQSLRDAKGNTYLIALVRGSTVCLKGIC